MMVPDQHYLLSKTWSKGCGFPIIKDYDIVAARIAMVIEFLLKIIATSCSSIIVFLTPFDISTDNPTSVHNAILSLNITACICAAIISVIESQFSMQLSSQNNETKTILAVANTSTTQPRPANSIMYLLIKILSMLTSFTASALNAAIANYPTLPSATVYMTIASVLSAISMMLNNLITFGSNSAGSIYLKVRERVKQINIVKQV